MRAFAEALDSVPMALAENSGLSPIETLASVKSRHVKEKNSRLGIDCMQTGSNGTFEYNICWAQMLHGKEMVSALLLGRLYLSNSISELFFFFNFFTIPSAQSSITAVFPALWSQSMHFYHYV